MTKKYFFRNLSLAVLLLTLFSVQAQKEKKPMANDYSVAAYVWPSLHDEERSREILWPDGMGEWEIIKKGNPRFEGHYQPKIPLWGYEMDDDPKVMEKWINAATDHGVNVFIFDWYWFGGKPFLESSINNGFLKAGNNKKMKFYVMWANHDVKRNYWNVYKYEKDTTQLWDGAVDLGNFKKIVQRVTTQYFHKPNYFKIDGKPVFSIFSIDNLIEGLGSLEKAREALNYFRSETEKVGFPGLHIQLIGNGAPSSKLVGQIKFLGVDSVTKYNWGGRIRRITYSGAKSPWTAAGNGRTPCRYPTFPTPPLAGTIRPDSRKRGSRMLCTTTNPRRVLPLICKRPRSTLISIPINPN